MREGLKKCKRKKACDKCKCKETEKPDTLNVIVGALTLGMVKFR
jgi:hypothetical protein